jgi:DNA-binding transcriptional LysR family regulator
LRLLASSEQAAAFDAGALDLGFMMSNVSSAPLQALPSGFGYTILDASFVPTLPPGVRPLRLDGVTATLDVSLVWRPDGVSPLVPRFVKVAERLKRKSSRARRND